ncbi:conserved hypothetical protein [Candidatus Sulfopaludibacter sp. SbA3]|nr:conserved hypothetical protein [Candidatus Sulfopaludibacter sp. SbA3]
MLAALVLGAGVCAAPADPWLRVTSANFELFTTAGERGGRDLIQHFERVRSFFQQAFGLIPAGGNPVQIIVFRSPKEYDTYKLSEVSFAYFESGIDHDFIVMQSASAEHYPVAVHEYAHLLLHQTGKVPRWLNEGLAELYSNLESRDGGIVVGQIIDGRMATLQNEKWLDLQDVTTVDEHSPLYSEKTHAGMFYAESWFLVHMLALQEWYAPRFRQLGAALLEGDTASAFLKVYGKTVEQVQQDLQLYFQMPRFTGRLFHVRLPESVEAPAIEHGGFRARVALAEVLNSIPGRREAARSACDALAREFPDQWQTEQRLAEFFWRERNLEEAAQHFARAAELGADDAHLYMEYGRVQSVRGRYQEAAAALRVAVKRNSQWNEAHFELAIALVQSGSYREALREFDLVHKLPSEQAVRFYYNQAYAHYRLGDNVAAKKLLDKAAPLATTDRERAPLEELRAACCAK